MRLKWLFICLFSSGVCGLFAQNTQTPVFYIDRDTVLCSPQALTLNGILNVPGANYQTTSYSVSTIPYTPDNFNSGTPLVWQTNGDDEVHFGIPIGFPFCFFGNTRTTFDIGTNGWVGFSNGPTNFSAQPIPSTNAGVPKDCIMGIWQDWWPSLSGGSIRYYVTGTAPFRRMVVNWLNTPLYSCTNLIGTFQIILYETTNVIDVFILNKPTCVTWQNGFAVQGIQNLAGTTAFAVPGRNSTQWTANNDGKRFTPNGPQTPLVINWFDVTNSVALGTGNSMTVNPTATTQYAAYVVFECVNDTAFDTVRVTVSQPMASQILSSDDTCLYGMGTASLNLSGGQSPYSYQWSNGATQATLSGLSQGTYSVLVTDANNCTHTATANVVGLPPPSAQFTHFPNVVTLVDPQCSFTDMSQGAVSWFWNFGDGNTDTLQNPVHTYTSDGTFLVTLILNNQFGCTDTLSMTVLVEGYYTFYVPNCFTPNNSGVNEIFVPLFTGIIESSYTLRIYNRWGELIFKTQDPYEGWNGKKHNTGARAPEGVYVYLINFMDFNYYIREKKGHVTLIR